MSDAQTDERRAYYKHALEEAQAKLDAYGGDYAGRHDLSKQVQHLWNAYAGAGGNWADLSHVKAKRRKK
jgi:hypothetical protein